jgi:hypothetical protein
VYVYGAASASFLLAYSLQLAVIHGRVDPLLTDLCTGVKTGEDAVRVAMADALAACLPKVYMM